MIRPRNDVTVEKGTIVCRKIRKIRATNNFLGQFLVGGMIKDLLLSCLN